MRIVGCLADQPGLMCCHGHLRLYIQQQLNGGSTAVPSGTMDRQVATEICHHCMAVVGAAASSTLATCAWPPTAARNGI